MAHGDAERGNGRCSRRRRTPAAEVVACRQVQEVPGQVVTVTYSPGDRLEEFIESLASATVQPVEVVLADNGSTDGSPERVTARYPHVRLLPTGGNIGYGAAANAGLADLSSGHAIIANPDVRFEPGSVDELIAVAERWPVQRPSARDPPRRGALSLGAGPAPAVDGCGTRPARLGLAGESVDAAVPARARGAEERPAGWLSGSCLLVDVEPSGRSGVSTPATSCTSRTSTSRSGWAGGDGCTSTHRRPSSCTRVGATQREPHRMQRVHHTSALGYLSGRHPGPARAPLRMALRAGLGAHAALLRQQPGRRGRAFPAPGRRLGDVPARGKGN